MPSSQRKKALQNSLPLDVLGAGDTELIHPLLPSPLSSTAFSTLLTEVNWRTMLHRGGEVPRRVAVQGTSIPDPILPNTHAFPIYRHPADTPPDLHQERFTPTVEQIRKIAEEKVGHELNHVLIQHYRGGQDFISEHSDKTLDVVRGTKIVNVSLGAERVMTLRLKRDAIATPESSSSTTTSENTNAPGDSKPPPRPAQRIPLPHNSLFVMGPETNKRFLHGINHDNRPESTKKEEELAYGGERISLTFRCIGSWLVPVPGDTAAQANDTGAEQKYLIYGQGATSKTREGAKPVPPPPSTLKETDPNAAQVVAKEAEATIKAFGEENFSSTFDWDKWYGDGFDVIHFV
ncbi:isochorismatase [Coprinopsis cinerea okayama7|uniref:Isochorismatase n=1 Tax=Coprinopsis cinerea (strain Okayama-7 / 130 / ATCC MYA-4618 / FGSC 9003) TaxID=240176 RepID=A8P2M7_COPC7|nr:isochorismatase [Coprinopsis cinerea okayama7\|eukprot:XP_001838363.1 isochorismatase [Coprinopsis cinerea okayama7\